MTLSLSSKQNSLPKWLLAGVIVLALFGFADSAYLAVDHYVAVPLPCTLTQGCDAVLTSKYAEFGPIPVAVFGVLYYLTVLFLAAYAYTSEEVASRAIRSLFGITIFGFLASGYFFYLQAFVIWALCVYCLGSAAFSTLLLLLTASLVAGIRKR